MTMIRVTDDLGALRAAVQAAISYMSARPMTEPRHHTSQLRRLVQEIDTHRPVDGDGNHRDMHTPTCGCKEKTTS